jgi:hypothetical protein
MQQRYELVMRATLTANVASGSTLAVYKFPLT